MKRVNALLLATILFLASVTAVGAILYRRRPTPRESRLLQLADDDWCRRMIADKFPDYPVILYLGNVTWLTRAALDEGRGDAWEVVWISGRQTEAYRWFYVSMTQHDFDFAFHDITGGFITSNLEIYEDPPWGIPPGP